MTPSPDISISSCGTFHLYQGAPLYSNRFLSVLKFSPLGLAAVRDDSGAYHIHLQGLPAYQQRYDKTYGFYHERAAVAHDGVYFHIKPDGAPAYQQVFLWVGNFQENYCVVKESTGFYHIDKDGHAMYHARYDYVGDFKDGIAVVYKGGVATHIDYQGNYLHHKWFRELDIYHKGFARAEDEEGWFHIDQQGNAIYTARYKEVEHFYNDLAKVKAHDGAIFQINLASELITRISEADSPTLTAQLSDDFVGFWKTFVIYAGVKLGVFDDLPATDEYLAQKLAIPVDNLKRLLRALWEMKLIDFDLQDCLWSVTEKGKLLQERDNKTFLPFAAVLWANVANQDWFHLADRLKHNIQNHRSFKDNETDEKVSQDYFTALSGYALNDLGHFFSDPQVLQQKWIGFGRSSFGIIKDIAARAPKYNASIFVDSHIPQNYSTDRKMTIIDDLDQAEKGYDVGLVLRFLHYFDDETVIAYLKKMYQLQIQKLLIFETVINNHSPMGGLLDINMLMETGGKLRTIAQWQGLIEQSPYAWVATKVINPYLSLLELVGSNARIA